jgi:hypothetical protein
VFESDSTKSDSTNFDGSNGRDQIFMRDRLLGTTTGLSKTAGGTYGNYDSNEPSISCSGRYVVFSSTATNLTGGNNGGYGEIILADISNGTRIFTDITAGTNNTVGGWPPSISCDGNFVVYASEATNLVASDTNGVYDVFRYDAQTGTTIRVSVNTGGTQTDSRAVVTNVRTVSGDGNIVVFSANDPSVGGTGLIANDNNGKSDVFLRNISAGTTEVVSINSSAQLGNMNSGSPTINPSGTIITYNSQSDNLYSSPTNSGFVGAVINTASQLSSICGY